MTPQISNEWCADVVVRGHGDRGPVAQEIERVTIDAVRFLAAVNTYESKS